MIVQQDQEIPSLDGLAYQAQHFIDTGSKMSDVLLALDSHNQLVALKIASVNQRRAPMLTGWRLRIRLNG